MDDGSSVDFFYTLEYSGFEFVEGLNSDMPKKASRHLAELSLDNSKPGPVFRRQDVLEPVGMHRQERLCLSRNMRGMIVQYDSDGAIRRILRVKI